MLSPHGKAVCRLAWWLGSQRDISEVALQYLNRSFSQKSTSVSLEGMTWFREQTKRLQEEAKSGIEQLEGAKAIKCPFPLALQDLPGQMSLYTAEITAALDQGSSAAAILEEAAEALEQVVKALEGAEVLHPNLQCLCLVTGYGSICKMLHIWICGTAEHYRRASSAQDVEMLDVGGST